LNDQILKELVQAKEVEQVAEVANEFLDGEDLTEDTLKHEQDNLTLVRTQLVAVRIHHVESNLVVLEGLHPAEGPPLIAIVPIV
jgi:hypothetical protein